MPLIALLFCFLDIIKQFAEGPILSKRFISEEKFGFISISRSDCREGEAIYREGEAILREGEYGKYFDGEGSTLLGETAD